MIILTRLSGAQFALNCDLIERVDATPDTVITMIDHKKYVVSETVAEVVDLVNEHRAELVARRFAWIDDAHADSGPRPSASVHLISAHAPASEEN